MKLVILGSGGAIPTPRPFCQCKICVKARKIGEPFKRNSSSLFIADAKTVIDCGEDIGDSLNRRNIKQVDNLFITHWHPDHTFGLRHFLEANYIFSENKVKKAVQMYIPKRVFSDLIQKFPTIEYYLKIQKTAVLHLIEDGDKIKINNIVIGVVGYQGKKSEKYAYLIEEKNKKVLYASCDTMGFKNYKNHNNLDLLINECGLFSKFDHEISFVSLMQRLKEIKPKRIILTHIEEEETHKHGEKHFEKMKKRYLDIPFDYAYDGLIIKI
ncbi:MAG: MBL fold metallo-hydrolase [archaeon]